VALAPSPAIFEKGTTSSNLANPPTVIPSEVEGPHARVNGHRLCKAFSCRTFGVVQRLCGTHFFYLVIPSRPQPRSAARTCRGICFLPPAVSTVWDRTLSSLAFDFER
jgi:hypothetical protein